MAQDNQVVIVGNLTRDPELRYTPNGAALVKFGVAVSRRFKDEATGEGEDAETAVFDVTAWGQLAENVAETLTQGSRGVVVGRLRTNSWETPQGEKRSKIEIEAEEVGPSLKWATAKIEKTRAAGSQADWAHKEWGGRGGAPGGAPEG